MGKVTSEDSEGAHAVGAPALIAVVASKIVDGRSVVLQLTREGQARANRVLQARASVTNKVFDALSTEQQDALAPIMEAVLEALTQSKDGARRICRLCDEQVCRPQGCPVEIVATSSCAARSVPTAST